MIKNNLAYDSFILQEVRKFFFTNIGIGSKNFNYCFGKSLHIPLPNFWVRTFQFGHDIEALCELSKYVNDGVGK